MNRPGIGPALGTASNVIASVSRTMTSSRASGPPRRGGPADESTGVEAGVAVLAVVQHRRALGEPQRVGGYALRQVEVAALADDLLAVGDLAVQHVELGVRVVDARAAAPVGVEVDAQGGRAVLLVDRQPALARAPLATGQLGGVPDVVILVDQLDVRTHRGTSCKIRNVVPMDGIFGDFGVSFVRPLAVKA